MARPVQLVLQDLVRRIPRMYGVLVTDKDGVELMRAETDQIDLNTVSHTFLSVVASSGEQAGKLELGNCKYIVACYDTFMVVQVNMYPLAVSLIASPDANTGLLLNAIPELRLKLEGIRSAVLMHVHDPQA